MKQDKELLLKDLCARLPYKPQVVIIKDGTSITDKLTTATIKYLEGRYWEVKPYLFPMSSMTDEQKKEFEDNFVTYHPYITGGWYNIKYIDRFYAPIEVIDWLNKNHFDYRGLIPKGLAIDCTNLNIY